MMFSKFAWTGVAFAAAGLLAAPTIAAADSFYEVESARANARAGGPTNFRDAELLERYGALSGTRGYSPGGTYRLDRYDDGRAYGYRGSRRRHWRD